MFPSNLSKENKIQDALDYPIGIFIGILADSLSSVIRRRYQLTMS